MQKWWERIGTCAMALIVLVAAFVVIYWLWRLPIWSSLNSGWVQAIGSVLTLAVAIFVMSCQNAHATRLVVEADQLALKRRIAAITAIVSRAKLQYFRSCDAVKSGCVVSSPYTINESLELGVTVLNGMLPNLQSIPLHDLGSYEMADAVISMIDGIRNFEAFRAAWCKGGNQIRDAEMTIELLRKVFLASWVQFEQGVDSLQRRA